MTANDVSINEYNPFYQTYINKAQNVDLKRGLRQSFETVIEFLNTIPEDKLEYRYADGKWTIKEVIQHIIDAERIFAYRALRIARQDQTPLPGFEENDYVPASFANDRSRDELLSDYKAVREATISLFDSFTDAMLLQIGTASNSPISVRALGFITIGHENHHCQVIKERYL
uniref:DinB family protein n=1 Tax=Gelidibacter sp. TaxID=2018083 RepID=UPI00404A2B8D